ncbi:hypothetical protein LTR36_007367 [Oleoguttula mirabilis]|uniref:Uncharacterized protein n=1 Tax=Oleoguttula mirabilis TaxID=1507867 RepID=A0AAV9JAP3_9PEZI|nr:hypothetical protein LTR36_007367 [Oleoguttula mirabilis]
MKLLLDPEQRTKFDDPELVNSEGKGVLSLPPNKGPIEVCADFLCEVAKFAFERGLKKSINEETLAITPFEVWLTVPAVWSDSAKADTLRAAEAAAKQAKIAYGPGTKIFLIREPEAAAIATSSKLTQGGMTSHVRVGDGIIVCDCGGGTVDVTTYEVEGIEPKLMFKELVAGDVRINMMVHDDFRAFFQAVVDRILSLLRSQIDAARAVSRGAAIKIFNDKWSGVEMVAGNMSWSLAKGTVVKEDTCINLSVVWTITDKQKSDWAFDVFCCDLDAPPRREAHTDGKEIGVATVNFESGDKTNKDPGQPSLRTDGPDSGCATQ